MANPDGINQLDRFSGPDYGDVQKLEQLKRGAPLAGGTMPGSNAPQNAQRKATRPRRQSRPQAPDQQMAPPQTVPTSVRPEVLTAEQWKLVAASDPALAESPLVQYYMAQAVQQAGG